MSEYGIEYAGIVACFIIAGAIAGGMVFFSSILGKKTPSAVKSAPFECGETPFSLPGGKMAIKFYLTAILFILFDVEVIFLYPWAVIYRSLGMVGLVEMGIFLGILLVGYVYAWSNKALDWQ
jgi:NADH-quinone oxidoreductase subunit A